MADNKKSALVLGAIANTEPGGGGGGGGGVAGVSTFKGRSGNVYPQANDYRADMVTANGGTNVQTEIDQLKLSGQIDPVMSPSSERAVQNKAIYAAINDVDAKTLPSGGTAGDLLTKTDSNPYTAEWTSGANFMLKSQYDQNNNGKVDKADEAWAVHEPKPFGDESRKTPSSQRDTKKLSKTGTKETHGIKADHVLNGKRNY